MSEKEYEKSEPRYQKKILGDFAYLSDIRNMIWTVSLN